MVPGIWAKAGAESAKQRRKGHSNRRINIPPNVLNVGNPKYGSPGSWGGTLQ